MSDFKGRHFEGEVVLWAVRWYCRYGVSYRDLEQMMGERGVSVDHSTIYRWVQKYAPEIEKRLRWQWRGPRSTSWRIDETYVKVRGQWAYLYRAVDKHGNTIDFYLSSTRNTAAAKRFLGKALSGLKDWEKPRVINTDKTPTYAAALTELKKEGRCPEETLHRQVKYMNNIIESDHGKLKQLIRPVRGFKTLKTAYATIKGFEVMHALRKGQAISRVTSEARPASSSAPSVSAPLSWLRQYNFSANRSNSKRRDRLTEPFGRLRAARDGRFSQSPANEPTLPSDFALDRRTNRPCLLAGSMPTSSPSRSTQRVRRMLYRH